MQEKEYSRLFSKRKIIMGLLCLLRPFIAVDFKSTD